MARTKLDTADIEAATAEGLPESTIELGKTIGNVAMADALVKTDEGVWPSDSDAVLDMLSVSKDLEGKALRKYMNLRAGIGRKLEAAQKDYAEHRDRSARLYGKLTGVAIEG